MHSRGRPHRHRSATDRESVPAGPHSPTRRPDSGYESSVGSCSSSSTNLDLTPELVLSSEPPGRVLDSLRCDGAADSCGGRACVPLLSSRLSLQGPLEAHLRRHYRRLLARSLVLV